MGILGAVLSSAILSNVLRNQIMKDKVQPSYTSIFSRWSFNQYAPQKIFTGDRKVYRFIGFDFSENQYAPEVMPIALKKPTIICSWPMDKGMLQATDLAVQIAEGRQTDPGIFLRTLKPENLASLHDSLHSAADYALKNPPEVPYYSDETDFWLTNPNAKRFLTVLKDGVIRFINP